jgi:hypothetical protein
MIGEGSGLQNTAAYPNEQPVGWLNFSVFTIAVNAFFVIHSVLKYCRKAGTILALLNPLYLVV